MKFFVAIFMNNVKIVYKNVVKQLPIIYLKRKLCYFPFKHCLCGCMFMEYARNIIVINDTYSTIMFKQQQNKYHLNITETKKLVDVKENMYGWKIHIAEKPFLLSCAI